GRDIDLTSLHQLARGDRDSVNAIIKDMARSLDEDMQVLALRHAAMDLKGLADVAHRIQGGARIVGAQNVLIGCARLEAACADAEPAPLTAAVKALRLAMASLRAALAESD
ncbi:MAG: Hybrid sensory histidine kinase in two-component regulatory system with EvgA, partial [Frankiales bacterium]|nr:Hybrid sensory histidine kinase in two-component regulatory system with EvgA [Frankiales bacterium]